MHRLKAPAQRALCALTTLLPLCVLGCSRQPALIGTWRGTGPLGLNRAQADATYQFSPDGLVQITAKMADPAAATAADPFLATAGMGGVAVIHITGKYAVKDDVLTTTGSQFTMLDAKGQPLPMTPVVKSESKISRFSVHGDTLTLDALDGTPPAVLTRQKT